MSTNFTENLLADDVHYNQDGAVFIAEQYYSSISTVFNSRSFKDIASRVIQE